MLLVPIAVVVLFVQGSLGFRRLNGFLVRNNKVKNLDNICVCPLDFKPVCGVNNVTYPNRCRAACTSVVSQDCVD